MERREYIKSIASIPIFSHLQITHNDTEKREWCVRGVWKRENGVGHLMTVDGFEAEFEEYGDWHSATIKELWGRPNENIPYLPDFRLISIYDGSSCRSHFADEDSGLEATLKRVEGRELEYSGLVRAVDEMWDKRRIYHSPFLYRLMEKIGREQEEYL